MAKKPYARKPAKTPPQQPAAPAARPDPARQISYCSMPVMPERSFSPDVNRDRLELIVMLSDKWVNGTVLHYYFFDKPTDGREVVLSNGAREWRPWTTGEAEKDVVRRAFRAWAELGIGLKFEEVRTREEAEVRIAFERGNGFWSYLGRQVLEFGKDDRTMNFGRDLVTYFKGFDTAIHEIGHTLGFPHEHQNPNAGIEWNEEAVYAALAAPPNGWDRQKTFHNIIRKIQPDQVQGSSWDPDSVMHYPFGAGLINRPERYRTQALEPAGGLSERDKTWVKTFYPALSDSDVRELRPFESAPLSIRAGEQVNFTIRPSATRYYEIRTFGDSDTVMVLFEDDNGTERYLTADDDSGEETNAYIRIKLVKDHKYTLRVRLYYAERSGETAVMIW